MNLHENILMTKKEDFYETVGDLEGTLDASEIKDKSLINEWYDYWGPLEILRAVKGDNADKTQAKRLLKDMQQFLLRREVL